MGVRIYKRTSAGRRNSSVNDYAEITHKHENRREKSLCVPRKSTGGRNHHGVTTSWWRGGGNKRLYRIIDFKRNKDGQAEIHNIEMTAGQGGKLVRSAGGVARLVAREGDWATIQLPSGELRQIRTACRATIGQIGNLDHQNVRIGKAGRNRYLGWRPHVRGKAMNPIDHPMGGGEGRSNGGRHPCSPWGQLAKGGRTRSPRKGSTRRILRRRWSVRYGLVSLKGRSG
ncbi:MAG: 50S ribosomal protein L2 [Planctomycetes bacterium]|nr:50S ribosomal protein L2 [Planctomycetota bacterium]